MNLIPPGVQIPPLYEQDGVEDPTVFLKLFTPSSSWTWLLTEYDPSNRLAFGFAYDASFPQGAELGYVSVAELESVTLLGRPAVERDLWFKPKPLSEAKKLECPRA